MAEDKQKTILVVEDEPALQEAVRLKLTKKGINVLTANSGEAALEVLKQHRPDMVWLDMLLPGINGLEVLRAIRENPSLRDLPVIIASVSAGPEKIKEAFSFSVIDYLVKSEYSIDDLVGKAISLLNQLEEEQ
jgi:CheY-like chemotaxis protein